MHKTVGHQSAFADYRERNVVSREDCYLKVPGRIRGPQSRWQVCHWLWQFLKVFSIAKQDPFYFLSVKASIAPFCVHCFFSQERHCQSVSADMRRLLFSTWQWLRFWYDEIPNFCVIFYVTEEDWTAHCETRAHIRCSTARDWSLSLLI